MKQKHCTYKSENTISLLDSSSDEEEQSIFENMHDRMLKRARMNITRSIEVRMNKDDDEKKMQTSKWKKTVKRLTTTKKEGTHIDIIKDITASVDVGRDNILKSKEPPSSQEMLDRFSIYYDTD